MLTVAVLLSGRGSNLGALIGAQNEGLPIRLVLALSDRPGAPGLELARAAAVPTLAIDASAYRNNKAAFEDALDAALQASGCELVVLAGFMRVLSADFVRRWHGRMINIHPSLLPKYPGLRTHQRALDAGDAEHGASVHYVTPVLDGGPVLMQVRMLLCAGNTPEAVAASLLPLEHRLLVASVALIATGQVQLQGEQILYRQQALQHVLQLEDGEDAAGADSPADPT